MQKFLKILLGILIISGILYYTFIIVSNINFGEKKINALFKRAQETLDKSKESLENKKNLSYKTRINIVTEDALNKLLKIDNSETININVETKTGDISFFNLEAYFNEDTIAKTNVLMDSDYLYLNLPGYTENFGKIEINKTGIILKPEEIIPIIKTALENVQKSISSPEDSIINDYVVKDQKNGFTGRAYKISINMDSVKYAYTEFYNQFYDLLKEKAKLYCEDTIEDFENVETKDEMIEEVFNQHKNTIYKLPDVTFLDQFDNIYIVNTQELKWNGAASWEVYISKVNKNEDGNIIEESPAIFTYIQNSDIFSFGITTKEETKYFIYSEAIEKTKEKTICKVLFDDKEFANYIKTNKYTEINIPIKDITFSIKKNKRDNHICDFKLSRDKVVIDGFIEMIKDNSCISDITVLYEDELMATCNITSSQVKYKDPAIPKNTVDLETWITSIDISEFLANLNTLMQNSKALSQLIGNSIAE